MYRFYFQYIPEGKEYPVLCRKLAAEKNGWIQTVYNYVMGEWRKVQILLDWNEIAEQYGGFIYLFSYLSL